MRTKSIGASALVAALFICWASGNKGATAVSSQQSNPTQSASGDLRFKAPDGWTAEQASSSMRVALRACYSVFRATR